MAVNASLGVVRPLDFSGKLQKAWQDLQSRVATEKDPALVKALVAMGQILCSKESFEEAAEYFERAIANVSVFFTELFGEKTE